MRFQIIDLLIFTFAIVLMCVPMHYFAYAERAEMTTTFCWVVLCALQRWDGSPNLAQAIVRMKCAGILFAVCQVWLIILLRQDATPADYLGYEVSLLTINTAVLIVCHIFCKSCKPSTLS